MNTAYDTAALFDELEKIALSGAGSRGGKVHHYTAKGEPVYQSEVEHKGKGKGKGWTVGNVAKGVAGAAGVIGLGLAARKVLGNLAAKKTASRINSNHDVWNEYKGSYESIYNIGEGVHHEADHAAGKAAFDQHFNDARKAHDSAHHANNWKKWNEWDAASKAYAASRNAYYHAKGVREKASTARHKVKWDTGEDEASKRYKKWTGDSGARSKSYGGAGSGSRSYSGARSSTRDRGDAGARTKSYSTGHLPKLEEAGLSGIGRVKTKVEAKKIYRDFVIQHHPDRNPNAESTERLKRVNNLWDTFKHSDEFDKLAAVLRAAFLSRESMR
jgi:hypothetical protein